jgi:bifunctional ADP-heptose synthase (sugar kinase/adenylyltransferase)
MSADPLRDELIEQVLARAPSLTVGVLGDLFLDRYLDIDAALTEPSLETGLDAYQVTRVRSVPGAAGTVINNLAALGVGRICPIAIIGDDGEGHELRQALGALGVVDTGRVYSWDGRRTPTYTKPMLCKAGEPPLELNRLDIKNRSRSPAAAEDLLLRGLAEVWPRVDALLILDQVSEEDCGVVTARVREALAERASADRGKFVLGDSRERIDEFRGIALKPNRRECLLAAHGKEEGDAASAVRSLAARTGRAVFCTVGEAGILIADPVTGEEAAVPGYPVRGPIDVVGAGDSTSAGIACAAGAGLTLPQAAAFGSLVASITVQQIGTTGTASPAQVRQRWREVRAAPR